jgi:phage terminase large subunit
MNKRLEPTQKQLEALEILKSDATNIFLYGGSRSGKTYIIIELLVANAIKYPGSRFFIGRLHISHALQSLWNETLMKVLERRDPSIYTLNRSDHYVKFWNGSEIWVGGFDDKERTEKILGREFCRIYLNEVSQIPYETVNLVKTRLAQQVKGLKNKLFYDCNPPSPTHWTYKVFINKLEPTTNEPLPNPEDYKSLMMNPMDNIDNLDESYIKNLESLPEEQRRRFLFGEWVKPSGAIYNNFTRNMIIPKDQIPEMERYSVGVDLVTYYAVLIGFRGLQVYILDELGGKDLTASELNEMIVNRWYHTNYIAYIDHNLSESGLREFDNAVLAEKGKGSVEAGINSIRQYMEQGDFFISEECPNTIYEIENYRRDPETGRILKGDDHHIDAMRMAIYSELQNGYQQPLVTYTEI